MRELEPLLTEPEAADLLRLCSYTLRKARQEGRIAYIRIGRVVRYRLSDVEEFIEASREIPPPRVSRQNKRSRISSKDGHIVPFSARN